MLDDFIVRAALAGVGVSLAAAPLGCFVVWRRMAYFGDATAHAALLGVALALALDGPVIVGVLAVALVVGVSVSMLSDRGLGADTILGVLAHSLLAVGLLVISLTSDTRVDIMGFLVGDILSVSKAELGLVWLGATSVTALMIWRWNALLSVTLNPDLARASGINTRAEQLVLTLSLAVVVAVAIKVVGALLISALLIIPAAAARPLSRTPEAMAMIAAVIGVGCALGGLGAAFHWDTQTGPTIIALAALAFVITHLARAALRR